MLNSLLIQNIVLIDKLEIKMSGGLCVLSGETGSGKSILLDALGLAIGFRSNNRLLRQHSKQGMVITEFDITNNPTCQNILADNGLIDEENADILTLKRILFDNSTSKAFANDIPVSVNLLSQIGSSLIEIHGQHQQKDLLNVAYHKVILDEYARAESLLKLLSSSFDNWRDIEKKIAQINANKEQNERERDYLSHIVRELQEAAIEVGQEDQLIEKRNLLANKEKITEIVQELTTNINDIDHKLSCTQGLLIRSQYLGDVIDKADQDQKNGGNKLTKLTEIIDQTISKNDQAHKLLDVISNSFDKSDLTLEEVEERLFLIRNLSRKFNKRTDDLPKFLQEIKEKLQMLENDQSLSQNLEEQRIVVKETYLQKAGQLSKLRKETGLKLSRIVEKELSSLKMDNVKFEVSITELLEENYSKSGIDKIRFIATMNQNSALDDIAKIASGGELSRFMLALKVALSAVKSVPILIFDEIDTGIGGAVANAVGARLKLLSKELQIMVVTHHAQIAAKADYNLQVQKISNDQTSNIVVTALNNDNKSTEIARMLSGEVISDEAMAAAKRLISG